jgi:pSer/pThr/pTyr-binding forkhead associated (FHA) protein
MARPPKRLVDATVPRLESDRGVFPLLGRTEVGRMPACDVRLNDREVSKLHCTVTIENEVVRVMDEDSANGTFVNGMKIRNRLLREGDELTVGSTRFTVRLGRLPSPPRGADGESVPMVDIGYLLRTTGEKLEELREKEARLDAAISATEIQKLRVAA